MPKIHKGSRGGLYYKKRGRKIYISNFGGKSDGTNLRDYFRKLFKEKNVITDFAHEANRLREKVGYIDINKLESNTWNKYIENLDEKKQEIVTKIFKKYVNEGGSFQRTKERVASIFQSSGDVSFVNVAIGELNVSDLTKGQKKELEAAVKKEENSVKSRYGAHEGAQIKNALKEFAINYAKKEFGGADIKYKIVDRHAEAKRAKQMANDALAEIEMSNDLLEKIKKHAGWDKSFEILIPLIELNNSGLLQNKWNIMKMENGSIAQENSDCNSIEDYVDKMIKNKKVTEITDSAVALGEILKNLKRLEDNDLNKLQQKIQIMLSSFGYFPSSFGCRFMW